MKRRTLDNLGDLETRIIQYTKILIGIVGLVLFAVFVLGN